MIAIENIRGFVNATSCSYCHTANSGKQLFIDLKDTDNNNNEGTIVICEACINQVFEEAE